jgi:transcriptional regulator with XRE-family HTH domain
MLTPAQCRAARGLLDWTQQELADAAQIGVATVRLFEGEATESRQATLAVLRQAFELAGVEFIDENGGGPGVRLKRQQKRGQRDPKFGHDRHIYKMNPICLVVGPVQL